MPENSVLQRVRTRRAIGFIVMSALLPGSVQLFAGNKSVGRLAVRVFGGAVGLAFLAGVGMIAARGVTVGIVVTPVVLLCARIVLWVLLACWLALLVDSWRLAHPLGLERSRRLALTAVTFTLAVVTGIITAVGASGLAALGNVAEVFEGGGDTHAKEGRYNILLLGADASADREGLRPDSINVASVDAKTGRTVIFGLPRNLEKVPFPATSPLHDVYPDGYICGEHACMLNGVYMLGMDYADRYPGQDAGRAAMKEAVSEILGIDINYYALIDMGGFESLVDAMGGIRLNIGKPIPIGGVSTKVSGYIAPGDDVLLDGFEALWFARSRVESDDYERMVRQKCVMAAMAEQFDPRSVATKFVDLSEASRDILSTDVGSEAIVELSELALKAKSLPIASVNLAPPLIQSADPDFDLIRATVEEAVAESKQLDEPGSATSTASTAPSSVKPAVSPSAGVTEEEETGHREPPVCSVP